MKTVSLMLLFCLSSCAHKVTEAPSASGNFLRITEVAPNKWTALTRQNLEHLIQVYHLSPLIFTSDIQVQSQAVPKSHPVIILNTRFSEQPHKLMSAFVHEQLHWWSEIKSSAMNGAAQELANSYPYKNSAFLEHMIICFLEYDALIFFLEKKEADKIMDEFISKDKIHPWIYEEVMTHFDVFSRLVNKFDLRPEPMKKAL